jgi:hypothetical protein
LARRNSQRSKPRGGTLYKKMKGKAHIGKEWDLYCSSSDSDDEGLTASAFDKPPLFPNDRHTCLMAKEKKVFTRDTEST